MTPNNLTGDLVRLAIFDLEKDPEILSRWDRDSEYQRLSFFSPSILYSPETIRGFFEKGLGEKLMLWNIHALAEDCSIGFITLSGFDWQARSAWVGIGIGDPEYRGKGLGTDAMNTLTRYAFNQLNLNRINLGVFEYNPRAIRCYEKCGFVHEGRERQSMNRGGRRWDLLYMGLIRGDWLAKKLYQPPLNARKSL